MLASLIYHTCASQFLNYDLPLHSHLYTYLPWPFWTLSPHALILHCCILLYTYQPTSASSKSTVFYSNGPLIWIVAYYTYGSSDSSFLSTNCADFTTIYEFLYPAICYSVSVTFARSRIEYIIVMQWINLMLRSCMIRKPCPIHEDYASQSTWESIMTVYIIHFLGTTPLPDLQ